LDTRQQKIAQSFDRHLAVTANAGSGKTRVLVNRYINILLNKANDFNDNNYSIRPKNIVAITFTRKAAAEMLAKVVNKIEELIINEKNIITLEKLKEIREELTNARISTIHSFCADLLREFPIEAQVPPAFTEISGAQNIMLRKDAIISILEEYIRIDIGQVEKSNVKSLILEFGRKNIEHLLDKLSANPYLVHKFSSFYKQDNLTIKKIRDELLYKVFYNKINKYTNILQEVILSILFEKNGRNSKAKYEETEKFFLNLRELIKNCDGSIEYFYEIIKKYIEVCKIIFTTKGELRSDFHKAFDNSVFPFNQNGILNIVEDAGDLYNELKEILDSFEFLNFDEKTIENGRLATTLALEVINKCDEEKENLGVIDFEDMLIKTNNLLDNDYSRRKISERIKYLLVDEFQDTNDLQYEIIKKLIPELNSKYFNADGINLFIVGDTKQSIYSFRNANVKIFQKIKEQIAQLNQNGFKRGYIQHEFNYKDEKIPANNEDEILGSHILSVSFRLKPAVSAFVNRVCSNIMQKDDLGFEFGYEPLVCTRDFEIMANNVNSVDLKYDLLSKLGSVTFLTHFIPFANIGGETTSQNDDIALDIEEDDKEAELIAKHIKNIVEGQSTDYQIENEGIYYKPNYNDIAILARRKKRFNALSKALSKYGIPFVIHSGLNIFDNFEINDILQFLNFIVNNKDDSALITILRSPLFGFNDTEIYKIFCNGGQIPLWNKLELYIQKTFKKENEVREESNAERAYRIIKQILQISSSISFSELIIYMLDATGWFGTIYGSHSRSQIELNINKLISLARDLFSRGFKGLNDLVDELNFIKEQEITDTEQVTLSNENVVNIMTIHASKGLEFPITILFDTNVKTTNHFNAFCLREELGVNFDIQLSDEQNNSFLFSTPIKSLASYINKLDELAEEKRLLYVALTRAKDHLIITSTLKENKDSSIHKTSGLLRLILDGLKISANEIVQKELIKFDEELHFWKDDNEFSYNFPLFITCKKDVQLSNFQLKVLAESDFSPVYNIESIESKISGGLYSATRIQTYLKERDSYIKKYILGLPSEYDYFSSYFKQENDDNATEIGNLFHEVLGKIAEWLDENCQVNLDLLNNIINKSFFSRKMMFSKELKGRIFEEVIEVAKTDFIKSNINNIKTSKSEFPLYMPLDSNFLIGIIDILVKNSNNEWELWDWKSNKIENQKDILRLANFYEPQMQFYSFLLSKLYPMQKEYNAYLLFLNAAKSLNKKHQWCYRFHWNEEDFVAYEENLKKMISKMPF